MILVTGGLGMTGAHTDAVADYVSWRVGNPR